MANLNIFKRLGTSRKLKMANQARDARDYHRAAELFYQYLMDEPVNAPIWIQLGHATKEIGKEAQAAIYYTKALELNPNDQDARLHLAYLEQDLDRNESALGHFRMLSEMDPDNEDFPVMIKSLSAKTRSSLGSNASNPNEENLTSANDLSGTVRALAYEVHRLRSELASTKTSLQGAIDQADAKDKATTEAITALGETISRMEAKIPDAASQFRKMAEKLAI